MSTVRQWDFRAAGDSAEVLIYEDIGEGFFGDGLTAKSFREGLADLGEIGTLNVRINSLGGSVNDGFAIYNALREHQARVEVDIDGLAASIASVIAMAGDEIRMADNARLMVHDAWTVAIGNKADMRETAGRLETLDRSLTAIYARKTGLESSHIERMMGDETWLTADEAKELNFVHAVTGEQLDAAASIAKFDFSRFRNVPDDIVPGPVPERIREVTEAARQKIDVRLAVIALDDARNKETIR